MRIISKFHDYYDIGMGLGHDDSVVYVREPKTVAEGRRYSDDIAPICVGFCGKCYPGYRLRYRDGNDDRYTVCYTMEEIDKFANQHFDQKQLDRYLSRERSRSRFDSFYPQHSYWHLAGWNRYGFERLLDKRMSELSKKTHPLFVQHNCPIFVIDGHTVVNCLLKPYEFFKVFDPYTAYQELAMYVGGVLLAPVNPVPNVPDDTMRDIKGFDKWSFRKEPKT